MSFEFHSSGRLEAENILEMTTQETSQLFYNRDLTVSKKIQVYLRCLDSEPMTTESIILFFLFQRALILIFGNKKWKD